MSFEKVLNKISCSSFFSNEHVRNFFNYYRFGSDAPVYGEVIWVHPDDCDKYISLKSIKEGLGLSLSCSLGKVVKSSWVFEQSLPISEHPVFISCIQHWVDGIPWEKTNISKVNRYQRENFQKHKMLDLIFEQAKKDGRLRLKEEVSSFHSSARRHDYDIFGIGPNGEFFKMANKGNHRFAIAHILKIPFPVQIGLVHENAIPYLKDYRKVSY